jgi:hypothetical protein
VKIALQKIKAIFADSPLVWLSLITCLWSFMRAIIYHLRMGSRPSPLDLPWLTDSPIATEMNMVVTLTLIALIGVGAAVAALLRDKEQAWHLSLLMIVLNTTVWWYAISQLEWEPIYSS